jgi:hypothetical protein
MTSTAFALDKPANSTMGSRLSRGHLVVSWVTRLVAAAILGQTLFFKFTAAPESVYIFTRVHMEPWGRIGSGVAELIAAILLLMPRKAWAGALLSIGIMAGAIASHLTLLGIEVMGDGGLLFALSVTVFTTSAVALYLHRRDLPIVGERLS